MGRQSDGNSCYGREVRNTSYDSTDRYPLDVQVFSNADQSKKLHPTEKPVELCEYMIKTYTNEGDIVLDNCMGSGTCGVAAKKLGRKFIGIELDPQYFEIAKNRIQDIVVQNIKTTIYSRIFLIESAIHWQNYLPFAKTCVLAGYEPVTTISFE